MENQNKQRGVERELKELVQKYNVLEKGQIYAYFEKDGRERFVGRALKTLEKDRMIYTNNETKQIASSESAYETWERGTSTCYLYVCDGYPDDCDAYVGAHKKSLLPKGELADGQLRNKRILAHRALNTLLKEGGMTRKSAYIWLQNKLCLQKKDMHIAKFSLYYCEETIRVCNELIEWHQKRKGE